MFRNDALHHFTVYLGTYLHSRALRLRYSTRRSARLGAFNALEDHAVCIHRRVGRSTPLVQTPTEGTVSHN